jgi:RNA polymerase sigma-70 factor (ECF subfamily)
MVHAQTAEPDSLPREPTHMGLVPRPSADFEAVYRENIRFVWRSVRRLGVDPAFLDDIVQEAFLVVHRRLADFEGRSSTKTWLYGIVRRVIADHRRSLRRRPGSTDTRAEERSSDTTARGAGAYPQADGPDVMAEQAEKVRLLHRLLAELDDEKREVFILAEFEGMTLAEIAGALEVNPNTVSSRLRAARQRFEEALARATVEQERPE